MAIQLATGFDFPRADLAEAYLETDLSQQGFIADQLLPQRFVPGRRGVYGVKLRETYLQHVETRRARNAPARVVRGALGSKSYELMRYELLGEVTEDDLEEFGDLGLAEADAVEQVRILMARDHELASAGELFNPTTFPDDGESGMTVSNAWNNSAGDPVTDMEEAFESFRQQHSVYPDTFAASPRALTSMAGSDAFLRRLTDTYGRSKPVGVAGAVEAIKLLYNLENVYPTLAMYDAAAPGEPVQLAPVWDETMALLGAKFRSRRGPAMGWTFTTDQYAGLYIDSWMERQPNRTVISVRQDREVHLPDRPAAYLFQGVIE